MEKREAQRVNFGRSSGGRPSISQMTASGKGRAKCVEQIDAAGRAGRLRGQPIERLVGQRLQARAKSLDALPLEGLIDEAAEPAMVRRVAEQHVGGQRLQGPRQPAEDRPHPAVAGRGRALHEPMMVAQQVVDRVVGRGHPDLAEQREPHADHRPQLAHLRQGRETDSA